MSSLASVADLEVRLRLPIGSTIGADLVAAEAALADASTLVAAEAAAAGLETPWTANDVPRAAHRVVIAVAMRQYRNPDGYASENYGGAYSYRYADDETSAYLTPAEVELVRGVAGAPAHPRRSSTTVRTPRAY